ARRLNIKFVDEKNERRFPHTLNNTVIATSRALVAILENFQNKDGSVEIPKVLQKYMGGKKVIKKN
ncbi:MAG: aminoacyl--tRNA ligase-related protein, partial [Nanoarchaeota archaeon]